MQSLLSTFTNFNFVLPIWSLNQAATITIMIHNGIVIIIFKPWKFCCLNKSDWQPDTFTHGHQIIQEEVNSQQLDTIIWCLSRKQSTQSLSSSRIASLTTQCILSVVLVITVIFKCAYNFVFYIQINSVLNITENGLYLKCARCIRMFGLHL